MSSKDLSVEIMIHCPICNKRGQIKIEKNIVKKSEKGVTAINVAKNLICEHSFITYVDKNLDVRDSFVCDFQIEIPKLEVQEYEGYKMPKNLDLSIVKINLMPSLLAKITRTILLGEKLLILSEHQFLNDHYQNFIEFVFGDTFKFDLIFLTHQEYKKNKKDYKNHVVLDGNKIINDHNKILEQSKLKIELTIVQQFYNEYDEISSLILLKNEIGKIERIIKEILNFHKTQKEGIQFRTKEALSYLNNIYKITIQLPYFKFLLDIIENYQKIDLNRPSKTVDFLGLL